MVTLVGGGGGRSRAAPGPRSRALLEGEGGQSGQSQSGCRAVTGDAKAVGGGGFWRLEMRLGYGNAFRVESAQWGGGRGVPPPPFKRFPVRGGRSSYGCEAFSYILALPVPLPLCPGPGPRSSTEVIVDLLKSGEEGVGGVAVP